MRESEHFNLFLAEGSDIVNPLVQDVQNYETIDGQLFKNQNAGVQNATELKTGTVHAITRNVPDAQFITFTATSNYTAGETFTVDGVQVSALTVGGETLPTGAYVINSQVLCALKGTLLTVYGVGSKVADNSLALNGHPDTYFGTKEEVDNAIDTANAAKELVNAVNNSLPKIYYGEPNEAYVENVKDCSFILYPNIKRVDFQFVGDIKAPIQDWAQLVKIPTNLQISKPQYGFCGTYVTSDSKVGTCFISPSYNGYLCPGAGVADAAVGSVIKIFGSYYIN